MNDRLGPASLSVLLTGHPKLQNDLKRSNMEEIGYRTSTFSLDGAIDSRRQFIEWVIAQCVQDDVKVTDVSTIFTEVAAPERLNSKTVGFKPE